MIETYHTEVTKKRRNARWFWVIVFLFAIFLYFFFQGYYPDVRLGLKRVFSEKQTGNASGSFDDLIRSFGIINVKTIPSNSTISIGSGSYGNNEKRMTNYGDYTMQIENPGYKTNSMSFKIDKEKPYFIEEISLLPIPQYNEISNITTIYQIDDDSYMIRAQSGILRSELLEYASGTMITQQDLIHIGGIYFQSGSILYEWHNEGLVRSSVERENFLKTCPQVQWISNNSLYCPGVKSIYTKNGVYMTGIINAYNGLIRNQSGTIIDTLRNYTQVVGSYSGRLENIYTIDDQYYTSSGDTLTPLKNGGEPIQTGLDSITFARAISTEIVIVGQEKGETKLLIRHKKDPLDRTRSIKLPDHLDYKAVDFIEFEGNIFIKTSKALLFVYRGGNEVMWIVDGEILATYPGGVFYKTNNSLWHASWIKK